MFIIVNHGDRHSFCSNNSKVYSQKLCTAVCPKLYRISVVSALVLGLGPRYTKPGLQTEKKRAQHKYKKNNSDDELSVSSLKVVRHRYILFEIYGALRFFPPAVRA